MRLASPDCGPVSCLRIAVLGLALTGLSMGILAADRREQATVTKTGTIVEVQEKGRGRTLVVEIDGKQQNVPVTPKLDLKIIAAGDIGFVRPGQFLTASALMPNESNRTLLINALTIHPQRRGQKPPAGKIVKGPAEPGASQLAYDVSGIVVATQPNKEYPDHTDLALKTSGLNAPIMLEPGLSVTVSSGDPEKLPANASAEFEVTELRGGRINVVGITVRLDQPLTAAEYFGDKPDETTEKPAGSDADLKSSP